MATPILKSLLLTPDVNGAGPNSGTLFGATPLASQQLAYLAGSTALQNFGQGSPRFVAHKKGLRTTIRSAAARNAALLIITFDTE